MGSPVTSGRAGAAGPLRRVEEIAATVAHLAGPGGAFINGTAVVVDGGANA